MTALDIPVDRRPRHRRAAPPRSLRYQLERARGSSSAGAAALALTITLINVVWVVRDHTTPSWDQSHYLHLTWVYQQALDHHGPAAFIRAIYTADPSRAPLLSVAMVPLSYVFGPGPGAGLALNILLWPVLLLSAGAIACRFFGPAARLLTMVIIAPMPLLVALSHTVLQDFLLATLATVAIWLLLRTENFARWAPSIGLGSIIAAGNLTKISFGTALAGPLLVTIVAALVVGWPIRRARGPRQAYARPFGNFSIAMIIGLVPALLWYVPNWTATRAYLHATFMQQPGTVLHPLALSNVKVFVNGLIVGTSWLAGLLAVFVLVASLPRIVGFLRDRGELGGSLYGGAFIGSWLLLPVLAVVVSTNQGARYCVTAYVAAAVIMAGLAVRLRWRAWRHAVVAVAVLIAVTETLQTNVRGYRVPGLPANVSFSTPVGTATIPLAGPDRPADLPSGTDYAVGMIRYLESRSRGLDGRVQPKAIALLELQGFVNGNNLPYYAEVRGDPFTFATLLHVPPAKLARVLTSYNYAIYVAQPSSTKATAGRVDELNAPAAAWEMTPALFALFQPHPARIDVGLDGTGQSRYAEVLVRRR